MTNSIQLIVDDPHTAVNISFRFCGNSEAFTSELLEVLEEMFPQYYMNSDIISWFKSSTTHLCVTRRHESKLSVCG